MPKTVDEVQGDNCAYIGFRVTYTYTEPILIKPKD